MAIAGKLESHLDDGTGDGKHNQRVDDINRSGYPFQRRIAMEIANAGWTVDFEKQVLVYSRGEIQEVKIDVLARSGVHFTNDPRVVSVVECKRHNPEFAEWLFFSRKSDLHKGGYRDRDSAPLVWCHPMEGTVPVRGKTFVSSQAGLYVGYFPSLAEWNTAAYDFFLERQKNRGGKSRTVSSEGVTYALNQVACGVHGVIDSMYELRHPSTLKGPQGTTHKSNYPVLPVLVTTAPLFVCSVKDENINLERGSLDPDYVTINPGMCILCDYALPPELWFREDTLAEDGMPDLTHMAVWVVNAAYCKEFFSRVKADSAKLQERTATSGP